MGHTSIQQETMTDLVNTLRKIPQHRQKSEEWLNQRKGYLTSSDAATALGINPYEKPVGLLFKKCNAGKPFTGNIATRWGEKYEDEAIEKYCAATGNTTNEFGLIPLVDVYKLINKQYLEGAEILAGSPDGIAINREGEPILLEVKCPFRRKIKPGYCPGYYVPQVQLNMYICNTQKADFIEYSPDKSGGNNFTMNIVHFTRDDAWLNRNIPIIVDFWKEVLHYRSCGIETHPDFEKHRYVEPPIKEIEKVQCMLTDD